MKNQNDQNLKKSLEKLNEKFNLEALSENEKEGLQGGFAASQSEADDSVIGINISKCHCTETSKPASVS